LSAAPEGYPGDRAPPPEPTPPGSPPGNLKVLALLAAGRQNQEIAETLVLSQRTVDHHVSAILRKLGAHTRGQAVAEAARLGLSGQDR
jgi:DNA-binding NarL/FixJ family response regulator